MTQAQAVNSKGRVAVLGGHGIKVSMCLQVSETGCGGQVCSGGQCCLGQRISPCLSQYRDCEKVDKRDPGGSAEQAQHGAVPCSGLAARSACQRQTSCQQACVQPGQGLSQVCTILKTHIVSAAHSLSNFQKPLTLCCCSAETLHATWKHCLAAQQDFHKGSLNLAGFCKRALWHVAERQ